jgi:cell pole-organizing protein PopZ
MDPALLDELADIMSKELSKSLMITYLQPKLKTWLKENLPFYLKDIKLAGN